jgi:hypothetical protein
MTNPRELWEPAPQSPPPGGGYQPGGPPHYGPVNGQQWAPPQLPPPQRSRRSPIVFVVVVALAVVAAVIEPTADMIVFAQSDNGDICGWHAGALAAGTDRSFAWRVFGRARWPAQPASPRRASLYRLFRPRRNPGPVYELDDLT